MRVRDLIDELSHYDPDTLIECGCDDILGVEPNVIGGVNILVPDRGLEEFWA